MVGLLMSNLYFYPRSPCGERRVHFDNFNLHCVISIHALLAESDPTTIIIICIVPKFLSTLSLRRATHYDNYNLHCTEISIHALLAESDSVSSVINNIIDNFYPRSPCGERPQLKPPVKSHAEISIHALLAESDNILCVVSVQVGRFLSTLSLRRATHIVGGAGNNTVHFYPRSPCGERPEKPLEIGENLIFLSTLSLRRATASVA